MKTTPYVLLSFTLLSCSCIFSQNTTSESKVELTNTVEHKATNTNKLIQENNISYTDTALPPKTNAIVEVAEKVDPKTKVISNLSETFDDSVPRTTIDLF